MNEERFKAWCSVYGVKLALAVVNHPDEYRYGTPEEIATVADKMAEAFRRNSYNHDGHAIKATCKHFGIKHTRKAIDAFFEREAR